MSKRLLSLCVLLAAALLVSLSVYAESLGSMSQRVFDDYDLLTDEEEARLEEAIAYLRSETGMDYVILTTDANTNGYSTQDFADDFYDTNGFGANGILYIFDMAQRNYNISTAGDMIPYFTDSRVESLLDGAYDYVKSGDYYGALAAMLKYTENYLKQGVPADAWYDDDYSSYGSSGNYQSSYNYFTSGEFPIIPVIVGFIVALFASWVKRKSVKTEYGMLGSTYKYNLSANTNVEITESRDEYIRTDVVRIPRNTDNGRSSGGGHHSSGSHVSTHTSSHGVSHGGGGRHF